MSPTESTGGRLRGTGGGSRSPRWLQRKADITGNAREVLHAHASHVVYVPVPEPLAKAGLNTPEDYAAVAE